MRQRTAQRYIQLNKYKSMTVHTFHPRSSFTSLLLPIFHVWQLPKTQTGNFPKMLCNFCSPLRSDGSTWCPNKQSSAMLAQMLMDSCCWRRGGTTPWGLFSAARCWLWAKWQFCCRGVFVQTFRVDSFNSERKHSWTHVSIKCNPFRMLDLIRIY
jgi:hypothetical protein